MCKPKCKLIGTDGNVFALAARVGKVLKNAGLHEQAKEFEDNVFDSESYDEALTVMGDYVDIE